MKKQKNISWCSKHQCVHKKNTIYKNCKFPNEISNWKTQKLKTELQALYQSIYVIGCFGTKDMLIYGLVERELIKRGYSCEDKSTLVISKS